MTGATISEITIRIDRSHESCDECSLASSLASKSIQICMEATAWDLNDTSMHIITGFTFNHWFLFALKSITLWTFLLLQTNISVFLCVCMSATISVNLTNIQAMIYSR